MTIHDQGDRDGVKVAKADHAVSVLDSQLVESAGGVTYVRGEVLVRGPAAAERLKGRFEGADVDEVLDPDTRGILDVIDDGAWFVGRNVPRVIETVERLRSEGFDAQPNHVFFAHACCPMPCPHPADVFDAAWTNGLLANPMRANPMRANPMRANPMRANPMRANPMRANPMRANGELQSTAVPAVKPPGPATSLVGPGVAPIVVVLDTGIDPATTSGTITGHPEYPDNVIKVSPTLAYAADGYLDPVAGHGTFIAHLVALHAPGCDVRVIRLVDPIGAVVESAVIQTLADQTAAHLVEVANSGRQRLLNLSFGGPTLDEPLALRAAVALAADAGIVIVASAGNDATCEPQYPAAFPGVIAVAALDPIGPAPFTNFGDWVDACAPGTDLVSRFFTWNGNFPTINSADPDHFDGWATWSGTSFAAPTVVAALAREIVLADPPTGAPSISARAAAQRVLGAPHLLALPRLGTVVNR
jgi:subtilisin family serine protease